MLLLFALFVIASVSGSSGVSGLSTNFYGTSCPSALSTIKTEINAAVAQESRMGASLLRLHFHDCFVNGCDASVLLDDAPNFTGEKTAFPNANSLRGFEVIDNIKLQLESACKGVVSCADILAVAARDSVVALGGLSWSVWLGRKDSTTASLAAANSDLPGPDSSIDALLLSFSNKGFTARDLIALSGSHTIGQASCATFRNRIYNDANINSTFATSLKGNCPPTGGNSNLAPLDLNSPAAFDNSYYKNLLNQQGLLHSDQELFNGGVNDYIVNSYASNQFSFFSNFANAMVKMGNLSPATGTSSQIRTNCRRIN